MNNTILSKFKYQVLLLFVLVWSVKIVPSVLHAQQFNRNLPERFHTLISKPEKVRKDLMLALSGSKLRKDTVVRIQTLLYLSTIERIAQNYGQAFYYSSESLLLAEEFCDVLMLAKAHEESGVLSYLFKQDEQVCFHFSQSLYFFQEACRLGEIENHELYQPYYNMILYYQRIEDHKNSLACIDSCSMIYNSMKFSSVPDPFLDEKRASIMMKQGKPKEARLLLNRSIDGINQLGLDSTLKAKNESFLIILYASLANTYLLEKKISVAKEYFYKALRVKDRYGEHVFYRSYIYTKLGKLLFDEGDTAEAYRMSMGAWAITNNYLNPRNDRAQTFLSVKDRYSEELHKKREELNKKNIELVQQQHHILQFRIYLFLLILIIVVLVLVLGLRNRYLKLQKVEELTKERSRQSKKLIEKQNKELTANVLQLIEKEEIVKLLKERLMEDSRNKSLIGSVEKRSVSLWESFNARFTAVNNNFYAELQIIAPTLTASELKICALIKLNFSGKEMAYLLGISEGSVNVARHRLRKKMNLTRSDNLTQVINSI